MKTKWMVAVAAFGVAVWLGAARPAWAASCGDVNGSGAVDSGDLVILRQRVASGTPNPADCGGLGTIQCGDLNGSGTLSVADLVALNNVIIGGPTTANCSPAGTPECGATLSGTIGTNRTFQGGPACAHTVNGTVFVSSGVTLTFQPGAIVRGVKGAPTPSALVFLRGSKINAAGNPGAPILFTSNQADGSRGVGDWGGVVLNGKAPVNCPGGSCLAEGLTGIEFGGEEPEDNSGILTYVTVEYSGIELSADNELNLLTMNGVGKGTTVEYVHVKHGFDDGFEWFGGTVNARYLVASSVGDDDFDWQLGYTGAVQFGLGIKNPGNSDNNGRHGFEGDNNENGFNLGPRSNPKFCNITLVGTRPYGQSGTGRRGMILRRGTAGKIQNVIVSGFTQSGIHMDDNATAQRACTSPTSLNTVEPFLVVRNSIVYDNGPGGTTTTSGNASAPCTPAQWFTQLTASQGVSTADPNITENAVGYPVTTPTGAAAADGYVPTSAGAPGASCGALDSFFDGSATYIGAFAPGGGSAANWLRSSATWIDFDTN